MADNFNRCLDMLLAHEGGFVNHPKDPGGMTNLGVTKKVYDTFTGQDSTEQDMRELTVTDVAPIYQTKYWDPLKCEDMPSGVDWAVFDWGVNSGPFRSAKALQDILGVTTDGIIGLRTLRQLGKFDPEKIIRELFEARQQFYESLSTFDTFGNGWTRRNKETLEQALGMM